MERFHGNRQNEATYLQARDLQARDPIEGARDETVPEEYYCELEREREEMVTLAKFGAAHRGFVPQAIDVAILRKRLRMTRAQFARRFGFPVETVRHWERGDRTPRRAALVLLNLIELNSQVTLRLLRNRSR